MSSENPPRVTVSELRALDEPLIGIWSRNPNHVTFARVLNKPRATAYYFVEHSDVPRVEVGGRTLIPVPALLRWLGVDLDDGRSAPNSAGDVVDPSVDVRLSLKSA